MTDEQEVAIARASLNEAHECLVVNFDDIIGNKELAEKWHADVRLLHSKWVVSMPEIPEEGSDDEMFLIGIAETLESLHVTPPKPKAGDYVS